MKSFEDAMSGWVPIFQAPEPVNRKVFISHYHGHQLETNDFLMAFGDVFIRRTVGALGDQNWIDSEDTDYIMQQVRSEYIADSTVTIVLVGCCTHSRRYVDWESKGSLQQGEDSLPNGLIGIQMPSSGDAFNPPPRLKLNWQPDNSNCYARCYRYPQSKDELRAWIEDAFSARTTRAELIQNPRETMFGYDRECQVHGETH